MKKLTKKQKRAKYHKIYSQFSTGNPVQDAQLLAILHKEMERK